MKSPYDFGGRLTAPFPSQVLVDATEVCNLACTHCPHPSFKRSEHYAGRHLDPALNSKMVQEVAEHGRGLTQYIRYASNGEPLVHRQILPMMEEAVKFAGCAVTLTTNGVLLSRKVTERLVGMELHLVDISLDAFTPETYAKIRVGGDLKRVRDSVLELISLVAYVGATTKVVVSFVEQPGNRHETADFERYWKDAGADYVLVRRLHSCSGAIDALAAAQRTDNAAAARRPCLYPWERIGLNAMGWLAFCPSDWVHGSNVADYRSTTIREAWQGEFYQRLRRAHLTNDYAAHGFCGQCPDWANTRWPVGEAAGRSYADMVEELRR